MDKKNPTTQKINQSLNMLKPGFQFFSYFVFCISRDFFVIIYKITFLAKYSFGHLSIRDSTLICVSEKLIFAY